MPKFIGADGREVDAVVWNGDLKVDGRWLEEWIGVAYSNGMLFFKNGNTRNLWCSFKGGKKVPMGDYIVYCDGSIRIEKRGRFESRYSVA